MLKKKSTVFGYIILAEILAEILTEILAENSGENFGTEK